MNINAKHLAALCFMVNVSPVVKAHVEAQRKVEEDRVRKQLEGQAK